MILTSDNHTHTTYSHGISSVLENAQAAKEKGLKELVITDHGYAAFSYGMKREAFENYKADIAAASAETGVKVLVGVEANIISLSGELDITREEAKSFDVIIANVHYLVKCKTLKDKWKLCTRTILHKVFKFCITQKVRAYNTEVLVRTLHRNKDVLDVLSHPNRLFKIDIYKVAQACKETNTYFELNAGTCKFTKEELKKLAETGVQFVVNSDAHSAKRVGDVQRVLDLIAGVIPESQIANINGKVMQKKDKK